VPNVIKENFTAKAEGDLIDGITVNQIAFSDQFMKGHQLLGLSGQVPD
jgi:hypothetical protein